MDRNNSRVMQNEATIEQEESTTPSKAGPRGRGKAPSVLVIKPLEIQRVMLTLIGETPLIMHNFSAESHARSEMRDRMLGKPPPKRGNRDPKDPIREFRDSLYCVGKVSLKGALKHFLAGKKVTAQGRFYVPFSMLKAAIETAATDVDGASKAGVRRAVRVVQDCVMLTDYSPPYMVEHVTRLPTGAPDLRYRAQFDKWSLTFSVDFNTAVITAERLVNLFNTAGFAAGLGDWRPEKGGEFGRFHVKHGRQ